MQSIEHSSLSTALVYCLRDGLESLTKVKMAFVHLLFYLNRPCPSTTHRCGDLFTNTAIMQLAAYEIDITIEQLSFGQKVGQCASREV